MLQLINKINSPYPPGKAIPHRNYDDTFPFGTLRVESDDLDLKHLNYDRSKYEIDWMQNNISRATGRGPGIWLCKTKKEKELRKRVRGKEEKRRGFPLEDEFIHYEYPGDLYKDWLPSLDQARIQSRDLLDQILVCYTIKRALNDDPQAIEKLYGLYVDAAEGVAVNFAKKFNLRGPAFHLDFRDIKDEAREVLRLLLCGFKPEYILKQLTVDGGKGFANSLPAWVKDFFIYYFSEHIPPRIKRNLEETRRSESFIFTGRARNNEIEEINIKNKFIYLFFDSLRMLSLYTPIKDNLVWQNSPVRKRRFKSFCFQPGLVKMGPYRNLTTWIFGKHGKLYRLLRDKYKDRINEASEDRIEINDKRKARTFEGAKKEEEVLLDQTAIKRVQGELIKSGVSRRDVGIYFQWMAGHTQPLVGKKYNLSTRQIKRICQKVKTAIPTIRHLICEE